MLKFNREEYIQEGKKALNTRQACEKLADKISERGYSNIFFTGVGGTTAEFASIMEIVMRYSDVDVYNVNAAEILVRGHKKLNKDSIVITGSKSGDTKETVNVTKWCVERGIEVIAITGNEESPLAKECTHLILSDAKGVENTYLQFYYLVLKLLNYRGDFPRYKEFADQMENIHEVLIRCKEKYDPIAEEIAKKYHTEPYQIWVGSGTVWGDIYLFTMCILEEMQWMRTKAVTSPEFFHGALELVDDDTFITLVKGVGETRPLDERVERFLKKYAKKLITIDLADFETPGIDDEFRDIISPMILETITTGRLAIHYEANTGHDLSIRRYYRQFDY